MAKIAINSVDAKGNCNNYKSAELFILILNHRLTIRPRTTKSPVKLQPVLSPHMLIQAKPRRLKQLLMRMSCYFPSLS